MRCQAHTIRTYKTTKADSAWPAYSRFAELPQCPGQIKGYLEMVSEPEWGGTVPTLELRLECTHCKYPYHPAFNQLQLALLHNHENRIELNKLVEILTQGEAPE